MGKNYWFCFLIPLGDVPLGQQNFYRCSKGNIYFFLDLLFVSLSFLSSFIQILPEINTLGKNLTSRQTITQCDLCTKLCSVIKWLSVLVAAEGENWQSPCLRKPMMQRDHVV